MRVIPPRAVQGAYDLSDSKGGGPVADERGSVELVNVTKKYGDMVAVDSMNLSVHPGEFLSLLGPSGCGKTTTLRMLAGFEQPNSGHIRINGLEVQHIPPYKREVNTVFQHYALFPHMTVAENVAFGLKIKGLPKPEAEARVREMLGLIGLTDFGSRYPFQLSGGQQQRVALARALAPRPRCCVWRSPSQSQTAGRATTGERSAARAIATLSSGCSLSARDVLFILSSHYQ